MKAALQFYNSFSINKAIHWGKLISITGGAQIIVQGTGMLVGIIIIRYLPTKEYAYYTLANTMLGTMTILADSGISNSVMAQGGKIWQDKEKLGVVLATGLQLRKRFAIGSLMVSIPILGYLLLHNGADGFTTLLIISALIPSFLAALSDSLLEIVPKLHQEIRPLQKNQITVSLGRLGLSAVSLFILPYTVVTLLINGITRMYGNLRLMNITYKFAKKDVSPDLEVRREILNTVKKIMPITLYYCFSGQLTIWLLSVMGNTTGIAQIGALSRLSILLNLFSIMITTLVMPRFARITESNKLYIFKVFTYIQIVLISMCLFILGVFYTFPTQILWILGKSYSDLSDELLLMILSSCIGLVSSSTGNIIGSRGWFMNPLIIIVINILSLVASFYLFNLTQIKGILYYNILLGVVSYIFSVSFGFIRILKS